MLRRQQEASGVTGGGAGHFHRPWQGRGSGGLTRGHEEKGKIIKEKSKDKPWEEGSKRSGE